MNKPTLREQLEPLVADLEKARLTMERATRIVRDCVPQAHYVSLRVGSMIAFEGDPGTANYWLNLGESSADYRATLEDVIAACEKFDPEQIKKSKIAELEAELAELRGGK